MLVLSLSTFVFCLVQFSCQCAVERDVEIRELFLHIYRLASHWALWGTEGKGGGNRGGKHYTHKNLQSVTKVQSLMQTESVK